MLILKLELLEKWNTIVQAYVVGATAYELLVDWTLAFLKGANGFGYLHLVSPSNLENCLCTEYRNLTLLHKHKSKEVLWISFSIRDNIY